MKIGRLEIAIESVQEKDRYYGLNIHRDGVWTFITFFYGYRGKMLTIYRGKR